MSPKRIPPRPDTRDSLRWYGVKEYRVKVVAGRKHESVTEGRDGRFLVAVSAKREGGRANERMRELLATHFGIRVDAVSIRRGHTSATKTVNIRA